MSEESLFFEDERKTYGQDLSELLDDLFFGGNRPEIPNEDSVNTLTKSIPLDNEFGQKYIAEIKELSETRRVEGAEFTLLEDYLARVYYKHELEAKLTITTDRSPELTVSSASTEESLGFGLEETEPSLGEEAISIISEQEPDSGCIVTTRINKLIEDEEESPEDVFHLESPIFIKKSDLGSIITFPTEQERALLEKYAVLFATPLFKSPANATTYPSNFGVNTKRLAASGNDKTTCEPCSKPIFKKKSEAAQSEMRDLNQDKPKSVFQAIPSEVIFTDCKPGKIYQAILELKNLTTAAQQCNVLPPKSGFFLIGEGQYPTANKNFVAPGLSCKFVIKFRPKLFTTYEDVIRVNVSHGESFAVKLLGKRTQPTLEMATKLNCGDCFCGNEVSTNFTIKNSGGVGKFWFYQGDLNAEDVKRIFAADNELRNYDPQWMKMECFSITPLKFSLKSMEEATFTLTFKPLFPGHFCEYVSILCDNLTCIEKFVITGRSICLNLHFVSLKCRWNFARPHEMWDVFAEHFLNFDTIYAGNEETLSFTIRNNSYLPIQYHWETFYPLFNPDKSIRRPIEEPALRIWPLKGELSGRGEELVKLTYKPDNEGSLHAIVQLVAENIPRSALDQSVTNVQVLSLLSDHVNVFLNFVDVQGKCIEYNLAISPPQLLIHGALEIGTTHRQLIQLINHKRVPAYFKWSRCSYPNIVQVEPVVGFIGATYEMTLEVKVTGTRVGKFIETLYCEVQGVKKLLSLQVIFRICGHRVVIESGNVNFGLVRAGSTVESYLVLRNTVPLKIPWRILDTTRSQYGKKNEITLKLTPSTGEMEPLSTQQVLVSCQHQEPISVRSTLQVEVDGELQGAVSVLGEFIVPNVFLQACTFFAGTVYRSVPFTAIVTLVNNSALDTTFNWDEAEGVDAKSCTIHFEPTKGSIGPYESKTVCVTCTVNHMISFHDVCVPCWIAGMTEPLYWSVSGEVNGIEIFCSLDNDSRRYCATLKEGGCELEPHFDVDFGESVPIGTNIVQKFCLTNNSAIMATFKITGENFIATKLDEWLNAAKTNEKFPDYSNKKIQETLQEFLKSKNLGIAFIVYPPIGCIPAFNSANIEIIGLSDMWGLYNEMITVQVDKVKPIHMKINFNSVGIPLRFLAGTHNDGVFKLRLGNQFADGKKEFRKVKVINTGGCDLTVHFEPFLDKPKSKKPILIRLDLFKHEEMHITTNSREIISETDDREQLLELNVLPYYGKIENTIFNLTPNPLVSRARSESTITVIFTPPSEKIANTYLRRGIPTICAHCVGTVTINHDMLTIKNKVSRQHGRKVANFDFDISARLVIPKLIHVPDDDDSDDKEEAFIFRLNAGDFLFGRPDTMCKKRTISFRNDCALPLHVVFSTAKPFSIIKSSKSTSSMLCKANIESTETMTVDPGNIAQLGLEITLNRHAIDKLCNTSPCHRCEPIICSENCICNYCKEDEPHQVFFTRPLTINIFEASKREEFPLKGLLLLPYLTLAMHEIDFGVCFVGQSTCQGIGILNPTICDCSFCIVYVGSCNEFRVEPTEGFVHSCQLKEMPGRTELDVFFKPRHNVEYKQSILIHGPFAMDPLRVELRGIGTYDFNCRRDYDVVDST